MLVRTLPGLIATDCDGTLLRSDGTVSLRTRQALQLAADRGVGVVLVTARPPRWMHELGDLGGVHAVALCGNGAFTYDIGAREILAHRLIEMSLAAELVAEVRAGIPGASFAVETLAGCAREESFARESGRTDGEWFVGDLAALFTGLAEQDAPGKLLVRHSGVPVDELRAQVSAVVGGRAEVSHSGTPGMAEIAALGVSKGLALEQWCRDHDIEQSAVWAFGDMPNDLPMLGWAGRSFAVANAHPSVLAVADEVIHANDEDGVAQVVEETLQVTRGREPEGLFPQPSTE